MTCWRDHCPARDPGATRRQARIQARQLHLLEGRALRRIGFGNDSVAARILVAPALLRGHKALFSLLLARLAMMLEEVVVQVTRRTSPPMRHGQQGTTRTLEEVEDTRDHLRQAQEGGRGYLAVHEATDKMTAEAQAVNWSRDRTSEVSQRAVFGPPGAPALNVLIYHIKHYLG